MIRYNFVDFFRFVAAFFILLVHTKYGDLSAEHVSYLRLSARWAVPFFFICSGFFLGKKIQKNKGVPLFTIENNLKKLISILIVASIVYMPINIILNYFYFDISNILTGTFIHLWFVGSLIFGYVFFWYMHKINKANFVPIIAILIIFGALFFDSYDNLIKISLNYELPRFLLCIPLMQLGIFFSKNEKLIRKINVGLLVLTIFLGFTIQYFEAYIFKINFGYSLFNHELLIGTIIVAISVFLIAIKIRIKDNSISRLGLKYSLWIYLYHPFIYVLIDKVNQYLLSIEVFNKIQVINPIICFILTLTFAALLNKYLKKFYKLTNGEF